MFKIEACRRRVQGSVFIPLAKLMGVGTLNNLVSNPFSPLNPLLPFIAPYSPLNCLPHSITPFKMVYNPLIHPPKTPKSGAEGVNALSDTYKKR